MRAPADPASKLTFRHSAPSTIHTDSPNANIWSFSAQSDLTAVDGTKPTIIPSSKDHCTFETFKDATKRESGPWAADADASHCKRVSSIYYSLKSRFRMTNYLLTDSTGRHSACGATWRQSITATTQSGFGRDLPRSMPFKGPREGRENPGILSRMRSVGRLGQGPRTVPNALVRAADYAAGVMAGNSTKAIEKIEDLDPQAELERLKKRVVRMGIQLLYIKEGMDDVYFEERYREHVLRVGCLERDLKVHTILFCQGLSALRHLREQHQRQLVALGKEADSLEMDIRRLDGDVNGPGKTFEAMRDFSAAAGRRRRSCRG